MRRARSAGDVILNKRKLTRANILKGQIPALIMDEQRPPSALPEEDRLSLLFRNISQLSTSRFQKYLNNCNNTESEALLLYLWNIELCTALVPVLNGAEVLLRNTIHTAMTTYHADPYWFVRSEYTGIVDQRTLLVRTLRDVNRKRRNVPNAAGRPYALDTDLLQHITTFSSDDIVAETPFRYWTSLLSYQFQHNVWKHSNAALLKHCLPKANRPHRTAYEADFNRIREVRNRAYHNEPIYNRNPDVAYSSAMEVIGWMNSGYAEIAAVAGHFKPLWTAGFQAFCSDMRVLLSQGKP